ncbi:MAG: hypothetical protein HY719_13800 [Planctomycetes bacterium]|nr:hypothetical protein [Planctomycetota bacterium]
MGLRINTNTASPQVLLGLRAAEATRAQSLERLSTGLRINRAADDPAGLVVSEQLRAQVAGLAETVRANQGAVNLIRTTEAALEEVSRLLVGMRESTLLALNTGAAPPEQVAAEQAAVDRAVNAIDRIAATTRFAGVTLLGGAHAIETESTTGILRADVRSAAFSGSGTETFTVRVVQSAARAALDIGANASGALQLRVVGLKGATVLDFDGAATRDEVAEAVNRVRDETGVFAESGQVKSEEYGSAAFARVEVVSGENYSGAADGLAFGRDVIAQVAGAAAVGRGLKAAVASSALDADLYFSPSASGAQTLRITRHSITLRPAEGAAQVTIGLPSVAANRLGAVSETSRTLPGEETAASPTNAGSISGPGEGTAMLTIDRVPASLNGATSAAILLTPTSGFSVDFEYANTGKGDIDTATLNVTSNVSIGGYAAGANLAALFAFSGAGESGAARATIGVGNAFPAGSATVTASISDTTGDLVAERTYTFSVRNAAAADLPFEGGQSFRLVYDRDQVNIVPDAGQSDGTVVTAGADGESDFREDLRLYGLRGDTQAGADAQAEAAVKSAILNRMNLLYNGVNIAFTETTQAQVTADFAGTSFYAYGAGPGYSAIAVGGKPVSSGVLEDTGATIGRAQFDPGPNTLENDDTVSNLGIFLTRIFELAGATSDFTPLSPALGGTPLGQSIYNDDDLLTNGAGGDLDRQARLDAINTAIDSVAKQASAVLAHEVGHSLGLVPDGAPPQGFFGGSALFSGSTSGHLRYTTDPALVNVMNPASSTADRKSAQLNFGPLDIAYLRGQLLYDPSLTEGVAPLIASSYANNERAGVDWSPPLAAAAAGQASVAGKTLQTALADGTLGSLVTVVSGGNNSLEVDPAGALTIIDLAMDQVSATRAYLGSVEGKLLASLIASQSVHLVNLTRTESTIRDLDFAAETAALARAQVLGAAGVSLLRQANAQGATLLQLLR